jgi:hypothetical protein
MLLLLRYRVGERREMMESWVVEVTQHAVATGKQFLWPVLLIELRFLAWLFEWRD